MAVDLSLIRVFCAIYQSGSVSRAAEQLGVTQPAASYSLGRLRDVLDDALFIRSGNGMTPTPVADQLYVAFNSALEQIDSAAAAVRGFDPATSMRRFRVAMSDIGEMVYLPPLLTKFEEKAPHVRLDVLPVALEETAKALAAGQLDCVVGNIPRMGPDIQSTLMFMEHHVCMFRADHPQIGQRLTLKQFEDCRHIMVASPFNRLNVLTELVTERARRNIVIQTVHFTSVPALVAETDLIVTLPSRVARAFSATHNLRYLPLPVEIPPFEVRMNWHERNEADPAHRWLRWAMTEVLSSV